MKAMLLAAGLGTRMDSIGADLAKPALPILDEPLVLRLVRTLANEGIQEVVVNTHAHPDSIRAALGESPLPLIFSHEPELCGSGGGILNARKWLDGDEPFLVLNADMVIDLNLSTLLKAHQRHGAIATLVLRDDARKERFGHLGYDNHGAISRVTDGGALSELLEEIAYHAEDPWVRLRGSQALLARRNVLGVEPLIEILEHDLPIFLQLQAVEVLRATTGQNFGYDPQGEASVKENAVRQWHQWWEENKAQPLPEPQQVPD